ncbi:surfactin synthase thioesterase subunit [Streptacidiphilus sp. MAP12-20]|uniref:thioesterase II family protein n=1 Tax=Streptacidiphilus sp. MAP12-20 TaxID=3156299 RepID=UPI003512F8D2
MSTLPRPEQVRAERWIVGPTRSRTLEPCVRLVSFPNAGGTAGAYAAWRPHLPSGVLLCPVELPGHGVRGAEEPATDLGALAQSVLAALAREFATGEPYALFGHSFGGLLAFEVARRIEREGLPLPRAVVVSAVRAPHEERARIVGLAEDELLEWLLASGGLPQELLRHTGYVRGLLRCLRADLLMADAYRVPGPVPLQAPLHVVGALADPVSPLDDLAGWEEWEGDAPFTTTFFPGGHGYLFEDPRPLVAHLAALLLSDTSGPALAGPHTTDPAADRAADRAADLFPCDRRTL